MTESKNTIPEGWQLAPKEPTEDMLSKVAGRLTMGAEGHRIAYIKMLEAVPEVPNE